MRTGTDLARVLAGVDGFRRHRFRAGLGVLGVMLAVAVSLTTLAVNEGASREARRTIDRLGANTVIVRTAPASGWTMSARDATALEALVPFRVRVASVLEVTRRIAGPVATTEADVVGVTATFSEIRQLRARQGRLLLPTDDAIAARVVVLGPRLADRLFGYQHALGQSIRVGGDWYRVVGVLATGDDDVAFVPIAALCGRVPPLGSDVALTAIWIGVTDAERLNGVRSVIRTALARRVEGGAEPEIVVARELLDSRDRSQRIFGVVTGVTAMLLFVLGGLTITNVLLTAVVERTPEIGLRRAVGATRRDVTVQFLAEGAVIAVAGGSAGVAGGAALAWATGHAFNWAVHVPVGSVLPVFAAAIAVGIAAAAYPAARAARLQPLDALLHE